MNSVFSILHSLCRRASREFARAAGLATMVAFLFGLVGSTAPVVISVAGALMTVSTPARADCLSQGEIRQDIADEDCLEAQRTGCVRHMLTASQYKDCLRANAEARETGRTCIINGRIRNEFSELDCEEAKATGCVRRLLTRTQYQNCLDAQPSARQARETQHRCIINGRVRRDLDELDCEEAKATGCVRHLLSRAQYRACLDAQTQ